MQQQLMKKIRKSFQVERGKEKFKLKMIAVSASVRVFFSSTLLYFLLKQCQNAIPRAIPQSTATKVVRRHGKVDAEQKR